jgi:2-hydroxychromene-2-carboxylate isomerase
MRIDAAAQAAGVEVAWQPFLLGPIFKAQGWTTSPFNIYPAKGRYMVRDVARTAAARGLPFRMSDPFPANTLKATRLAIVGIDAGWVAPFSRAVFEAEFAHGRDIASEVVPGEVLAGLGLDAPALMARAAEPAIKERLRAATAEAETQGIFGAPSFVAPDGGLFWGDDGLETALAQAKRSFTET